MRYVTVVLFFFRGGTVFPRISCPWKGHLILMGDRGYYEIWSPRTKYPSGGHGIICPRGHIRYLSCSEIIRRTLLTIIINYHNRKC